MYRPRGPTQHATPLLRGSDTYTYKLMHTHTRTHSVEQRYVDFVLSYFDPLTLRCILFLNFVLRVLDLGLKMAPPVTLCTGNVYIKLKLSTIVRSSVTLARETDGQTKDNAQRLLTMRTA